MSAFDKLNERVRSIPNDLTLDEADRFMRHFGFKRVRQKGSHCIYKKGSSPIINIQGPIIREYQLKQIILTVDGLSD
jgi:predicted RNA binding protein YcfA (HicA-like mRNA interferase family)